MEKFTIDENEPVHMMRYNLERQILNLKKSKYNLILKFLNKLFDKHHKTLRHFKIKINFFKGDCDEDIEDILEKYDDDFKKTLGFDIYKYRKSKHSSKTAEKRGSADNKNKCDIKLEIYEIITELLRLIEYSMIINIIDEKHYYVIVDKPPKKVRRNSG